MLAQICSVQLDGIGRVEDTCLGIPRNSTSHLASSEAWICWLWIKYSDILPGKINDFLLSMCKLWFLSKSHNIQWFSQEKKSMSMTYKPHFKSPPQSRVLQMSDNNPLYFFSVRIIGNYFGWNSPNHLAWGRHLTEKISAKVDQNLESCSEKK